MNLQSLLTSLQDFEAEGDLDLEISGISCDSRTIRKGFLFAALPGQHFHGIRFLPDAERAGAVAVLTDQWVQTNLPQIRTEVPRLALGVISSTFYGNPSTQLRVFGVTGTNGKTTTTFLLQSILEKAGYPCGLLGTVVYGAGSATVQSTLTTPESVDLQRNLASMLDQGCRACAMEVSSHALTQYRVAGSTFEVGIFTNLTQDHLDYHKTMEDYFQAKKLLFDNRICTTRTAAINLDDPYGLRILKERPDGVSYGFQQGADFQVRQWSISARGSEITINDTKMKTPLLGRYNAYNICGAYAAAAIAGISKEAMISGIEEMKQVPGRLERIEHGQPFLILIDYAHTEDALQQLLTTVRAYTKNRLMVLFGCGGERDRGKRPLMGHVAAELADVVILTSDNPRSEDPAQIATEVRAGIPAEKNDVVTILDRADAIAHAVQIAGPGDTLVLAGKGHENYQVIGDQKVHFDEREVLEELLT